jgi:hypothetical protein
MDLQIRDSIERIARMYKSNQEAAAAMGLSTGHFVRLCRRFGIPTPHARRRERLKAAGNN